MHFRVKKCIKYYDGYFSMRSHFMIDLLFKSQMHLSVFCICHLKTPQKSTVWDSFWARTSGIFTEIRDVKKGD